MLPLAKSALARSGRSDKRDRENHLASAVCLFVKAIVLFRPYVPDCTGFSYSMIEIVWLAVHSFSNPVQILVHSLLWNGDRTAAV